MDIKTGVYTYLSANPARTSGAIVYPSAAPTDAISPYITYQLTERNSVHNQQGATGLQECIIQFDVHAFRTVDHTTVGSALLTALDGKQNTTFGTVRISSCKLNSGIETESPPQDASEQYVYKSTFEIHCWYTEA